MENTNELFLPLTKNDKIALTLRGHVRDTFDNQYLYEFLQKATRIYDIDIYIYTFNIKSSGKIYTNDNKEINKCQITEKNITDYFKDVSKYIKKITIDTNGIAPVENDKKIGNISKNKFCHMWNSIHNVIKDAKESNIDYAYLVNLRLDYFQLTNKFSNLNYVPKMKRLFKINIFSDFLDKLDKNKFIFFPKIQPNTKNFYEIHLNNFFTKKRQEREKLILPNVIYDENDILYGIDNIFAGKIDYLYQLSHTFVYQIDKVFDFLSQIYDGLIQYANFHGGCGGPHEAVLPLYIKNHNFSVIL
jgi:hypothetical protein